MPPTVALLHHLERASAGHAGRVLRSAGVEVFERDLRRGDRLPALDEVGGIVSFGGEQSVRELERHPYLVEEASLMRAADEEEVPVLGVCLGGQLLAHALGGEVRRMPRRSVEWVLLDPLPAAEGDPVFGGLPRPTPLLHWNEDAFEPPPGAVELLPRAGPGAEAFRAGRCAWGIQFHPEVDEEMLDGWYADGGDWLAEAGVSEPAARAADDRNLPAQAATAQALFGGFARAVADGRSGR